MFCHVRRLPLFLLKRAQAKSAHIFAKCPPSKVRRQQCLIPPLAFTQYFRRRNAADRLPLSGMAVGAFLHSMRKIAYRAFRGIRRQKIRISLWCSCTICRAIDFEFSSEYYRGIYTPHFTWYYYGPHFLFLRDTRHQPRRRAATMRCAYDTASRRHRRRRRPSVPARHRRYDVTSSSKIYYSDKVIDYVIMMADMIFSYWDMTYWPGMSS